MRGRLRPTSSHQGGAPCLLLASAERGEDKGMWSHLSTTICVLHTTCMHISLPQALHCPHLPQLSLSTAPSPRPGLIPACLPDQASSLSSQPASGAHPSASTSPHTAPSEGESSPQPKHTGRSKTVSGQYIHTYVQMHFAYTQAQSRANACKQPFLAPQ